MAKTRVVNAKKALHGRSPNGLLSGDAVARSLRSMSSDQAPSPTLKEQQRIRKDLENSFPM